MHSVDTSVCIACGMPRIGRGLAAGGPDRGSGPLLGSRPTRMVDHATHKQTQMACYCIYPQGQKGALSGELVADAVTNGDYSRLALGVRAPLRVQQLASGQYRGVCEPPVTLRSPARACMCLSSLLCISGVPWDWAPFVELRL